MSDPASRQVEQSLLNLKVTRVSKVTQVPCIDKTVTELVPGKVVDRYQRNRLGQTAAKTKAKTNLGQGWDR